MNTQNTQIPPPVVAPAAVPAPAAPAVVPPSAPVTPPEGSSNNQPPVVPPPAIPETPTASGDPLAGSSWPKSAQDRVRDLARKARDRQEVIAQKDAYIKTLEEAAGKAVHPKREQYPDGDQGDHAFVSAISAHNATLGGLATERVRAAAELETVKGEAQKTQQELQSERLNAARAEFKDMDQVLQASRLPVGQHLGYALQTADNGYHMMYILNKLHPEETARLNQMTWPEILQELPRVEAKYRASQKPAPVAPAAPATPVAPPIEPIGGDGGYPSTGNGYKEWEAERNKKENLRF